MNTFIVDLKNKPSELAKVAEAIAKEGIDITGFSGSTYGDSGTLALVTDNEPVTQRVLTDGGWKFRTIELVETSLANRPGVLAETARKLATAGINIEAAFPTSMTLTRPAAWRRTTVASTAAPVAPAIITVVSRRTAVSRSPAWAANASRATGMAISRTILPRCGSPCRVTCRPE